MEQKTTKKMKERLSDKWRTFRQWQQKPYEVAPLSEVHHKCATCGTEYQGNYCPRCGQSSKIGRYSFKNAFLLFLDVWGLGNRGMFRTLRDLILRPGYMIRDYLSGMQMAYFPPFKLFFLLTALSLVIEGGINLKGKNYFEEARVMMNNYLEETKTEAVTAEEKEADKTIREYSNKFLTYQQRFPNISTLAFLVIMSGFLYIFFRRSPAIPGLRYSEFLVSQVYITDMFSIYNIVLEFLCVNDNLNYITFLLPLIPLKQMSGFPWWKVIVFTILAGMMLFIPFVIAGVISMFVIAH